MDTRMRSVLHRFPAALDIAFHTAGQARDHDALCDFVAFFGHLGGQLGKFLTRFEIHFGRSRETDFGALHAEFQELQVHVLFLGIVPGLRKSLVTVTQRDVVKEGLSFNRVLIFAHFLSPCQSNKAASSFFV